MPFSWLGIFTSPAFIFSALVAGGLFMFHEWDVARIEAANVKAVHERQEQVAELIVGMSEREQRNRAEQAARDGRIQVETKTIIQEVTHYVSQTADSRCVVPVGFVQITDAAWGVPTLSTPAGGSVDSPSGVPLSRIGASNAGNAGSARRWESEARAWRKWYGEESSKANAFAGATAGKPFVASPSTQERK